jgi:glutamate-1-semialdehyde 2,1-aminomutase
VSLPRGSIARHPFAGIIVLPFNDFERVEETLTTRGEEIACVILEPVNYNSGTILPPPGYLSF